MIILGLNVFHGDASACLIKNGILITAIEEERFTNRQMNKKTGYARQVSSAWLERQQYTLTSKVAK